MRNIFCHQIDNSIKHTTYTIVSWPNLEHWLRGHPIGWNYGAKYRFIFFNPWRQGQGPYATWDIRPKRISNLAKSRLPIAYFTDAQLFWFFFIKARQLYCRALWKRRLENCNIIFGRTSFREHCVWDKSPTDILYFTILQYNPMAIMYPTNGTPHMHQLQISGVHNPYR